LNPPPLCHLHPCYEGNHPFDLTGCGPIGDFTFPIHEYDHDTGCSVTGGYVYRGASFPVLQGHYFFSDFCSSQIWSLKADGVGGWEFTSFGELVPELHPTVFGEDVDGELYVATAQPGEGIIYRFSAADSFKCFKAKDLKSPRFEPTTVTLEDQFGANDGSFEIEKPSFLCNPSAVQSGSVNEPNEHLACYKVRGPKLAKEARPSVEVGNQFGVQQLGVIKPLMFCVPSSKTVLP
jgi:hypothetical protein